MSSRRPTARLAQIGFALTWCVLGIVTPVAITAAEPASEEFFESQVRPILAGTCFRCHGGQKTSGSLRTDSRDALLTGGDSGPTIIPGNAAESLLVRAVRHADDVSAMPPDGKLEESQIAALESWINAGAPWPASTARFESAAHWAFQPVQKVDPPGLDKASSQHVHRGIDALIAARQQVEDVTPAPIADRRTLIRRATYDLTGLPPTPDEVARFEEDTSPAAFTSLVDRLLASTAYGEQWGRHWLDVVRYADTAGENTDRPLPHVWRYRNWVIEALNRDLPYDEFIRRQVAGDLMAGSAPAEEYADHVVATGYLALARRFGHDIEKDMHLTFEDVIDTLGKSVLGLTIGCARCHDHKYDPLTTRDYYGLYGIFASTRFPFPGCEPKQQPRDLVPMLAPAEFAARVKPLEERLAQIDSELKQVADRESAQGRELAELVGKSSQTLASADLPDGGSQAIGSHATASLDTVRIAEGDVLLLTIFPQGDHGADSTLVDFKIGEVGGDERIWSTSDFIADLSIANPHADRAGRAGVWCFLDAADGLSLLPESLDAIDGHAELRCWRKGDTPSVFANTSADAVQAWTKLPGNSFFMHPGPRGPVTLAWLSPIAGTISLAGTIADAHPAGDGVRWTVSHASAAGLATQFVSLPRGNAATRQLEEERTAIASRMTVPVAFAVAEGAVSNAHIQRRGEPADPGDEVPRKFPDLLGGQTVASSASSGRLELAEWLTDSANPLTARVIVNRVWHWHYGRPLVATPNDFGIRGATPTHPELLDYLASELIAHGWSLKWLHREIMFSDTYQRGGATTIVSEANANDAETSSADLYATFPLRRLSAEEIRDSLLAVSGQLDRTPAEAHPFPAESTWNFTQHTPFAAEYPTTKRSVYQMQKRNRRDRFLALFDGPDPNASTPVRDVTTVPTQALYFLNDPAVHAYADTIAKVLLAATMEADDDTRLERLCRLLFGRGANDDDRAISQQFFAAYDETLASESPLDQTQIAWSAYVRVLLGSNEFLYID